ncbi:MAG: T9SS type A sorting domain-containing protein [Muribaculaceae bacterium]|nr:T9SS type A sorting domain-containing protein [Muribaculaceae bacterium]
MRLSIILLSLVSVFFQAYADLHLDLQNYGTELEVTNLVWEYVDQREHKNEYMELEYHNGKLYVTYVGLYGLNETARFQGLCYADKNIISLIRYSLYADKLLLGDELYQRMYRKDVIIGISPGEYIFSYHNHGWSGMSLNSCDPNEIISLKVNLYEGYSETVQLKYNSATNVIDPDFERVYIHDSKFGSNDALVYERFLNVVKDDVVDETTAELYRFSPGHYDEGSVVAYLRADINGIYAKAPTESLPENYWSYYGSSVNPASVIGTNEEVQFRIDIAKGETMFIRDIVSGGFQALTNVNEDFGNRDRFIKFQNGMIWLEDVGNIGAGAHCLAWPSLNAPGLDRDALKLMMVRRISDGSTVYVNHDLYDKHKSMSSVGLVGNDTPNLYTSENHINYNTEGQRGRLTIYSTSGELVRKIEGNGIINIPLSDLNSGIYIATGQIPSHSESMTIARP